jgi:hypothetical protein
MDLLAAFTAIARRRAQFPVAAGSRAFLICRSMDRIGLSGAYIRGYSVNELVPDSRSWAVDKPSPFRWCFVALGNKPQTRDALSDFRHMCGVRSHRILPSCCIETRECIFFNHIRDAYTYIREYSYKQKHVLYI